MVNGCIRRDIRGLYGTVPDNTKFARFLVSEQRAVATRSRRNLRDDPIATASGSDTKVARLAARQAPSITMTRAPAFLLNTNR
jgi:hypothetical protein